jgi:hypothetical protein
VETAVIIPLAMVELHKLSGGGAAGLPEPECTGFKGDSLWGHLHFE